MIKTAAFKVLVINKLPKFTVLSFLGCLHLGWLQYWLQYCALKA